MRSIHTLNQPYFQNKTLFENIKFDLGKKEEKTKKSKDDDYSGEVFKENEEPNKVKEEKVDCEQSEKKKSVSVRFSVDEGGEDEGQKSQVCFVSYWFKIIGRLIEEGFCCFHFFL